MQKAPPKSESATQGLCQQGKRHNANHGSLLWSAAAIAIFSFGFLRSSFGRKSDEDVKQRTKQK